MASQGAVGTIAATEFRIADGDPRQDEPAAIAGTSIENGGNRNTSPTAGLEMQESARQVFELQPLDEGFGAWSYATSAFAMFIAVWGFPESFPAFQAHLSRSEQYKDSTILAMLSPGINDIIEGILFHLLPNNPKYRTTLVLNSIVVMTLSLILASCATSAVQIVLFQGVLFGIGGTILNFVHVSIFSEWFHKKRSTAMAFIWLGWRFGSLGFPLICQWLLQSQGYETTLQTLTIPIISLLVPCIVTFRGRYPQGYARSLPARTQQPILRTLLTPTVAFYLFITILFSMVINAPTMFLIQVGADMGLQASHQATAYTFRVFSAMVGIYVTGKVTESAHHSLLMLSSMMSSTFVTLFLWGFAKSRLGLYAYAIAIGFSSGGFDNSLYGIFSEIAGDDSELFTTIHGIFSFFRGLAVLSTGPVGILILREAPNVDPACYAIGKYKYLVAYVASLSFSSGALLAIRLLIMHYGGFYYLSFVV